MRGKFIVLCMLLGSGCPAIAQIVFSAPGVSIGINLSSYPHMIRVPGYPVYYASDVNANLFFYDGIYWVYQGNNWYASSWYNGPWQSVSPDFIPLYVLRIPVRYYRSPPHHFRGWSREAPPRWNDHWGHQWAQRRSGWEQWNRHAAPAPAPLPRYQSQYAGRNYPLAPQQRQLESKNYRYQPRDPIVQQRAQAHHGGLPGPPGRPQDSPQGRDNRSHAAPFAPRPSAPVDTGVRARPQLLEQPGPAHRDQGGRWHENRGQGQVQAREGRADHAPRRDKDNN